MSRSLITLSLCITLFFYGQVANAQSTALDFEKDFGQFVDIGTSMNGVLSGTNQITVESWVKLESSGAFRTIVGNYNSTMQFLLRIDNGKATFWVHNGSNLYSVHSQSNIPVGTWTHIAGTWNGVRLRVMVNGVEEGASTVQGAFPSVSSSLHIGGAISSEVMDGLIDDVRIWNTVKAQPTILADMNKCLTGNESGLLAFYNFDTGAGSTLIDRTGNGYNGSLSGPVWVSGKGCSCPVYADQIVNTSNFSAICSVDTSIELDGSEVGVFYSLTDSATHSYISNSSVVGTGGVITLPTGSISSTTTMNIFASRTSGDNAGLYFDGVDDYVVLGDKSYLNFDNTSTFTIEGWVQWNTTTSTSTIFAKMANAMPYRGYNVLISPTGDVQFQLISNWSTDAFEVFTTSTPFADNQYHHLAVSYDGSSDASGVVIYVDGIAQPLNITLNNLSNSTSNTVPASIGTRFGSSNMIMNGSLDEIRVWNTLRTQTEIQNNLTSCLSAGEAGLVALYKLNDGIGSNTAADASINGNTGLLNNMNPSTSWNSGAPNLSFCPLCESQLSSNVTITINPISDQSVSITDTTLCPTNSGTTVTTASSELGVSYYLRDNTNDSIIDGPLLGTGNGLTFNTGVLNSNTAFNVTSSTNTALQMNGVNQYVKTPNLVQNNTWTYETWVRPDDSSPEWSGIITSNSSIGTGMWFQLTMSNTGQLRWDSYLPSLTILNIGTVINDNVWHHIAVTCDGVNITFYIDGTQVLQQAFTGGNMDRPLHIMAERTPTIWTAGQIDETMAWDYARNASEILTDMTVCLNGNESGLLLYFNYEGGNGNSVTDLAGGDHNGTLMNMGASSWVSSSCPSLGCLCSLEMSSIVNVTVHDIESPSITPPADITISVNDLNCSASGVALGTEISSDNCSTPTVNNDAPTIFPLGVTTITWTATDAVGNVTTATQSVTVTSDLAVANDSVHNVLCYGDSNGAVFITASGGASVYAFSWDNGDTTEDVSGLSVGAYTVVVTDSNGCIESTTATITEPAAIVLSSIDTDEMQGNDGAIDLTVNGGVSPFSFIWNNNETTEDISGLSAGSYSVVVTDANGCMDSISTTIGSQVSIIENKGLVLNIYPNPVNDIVTIDFSEIINGEINVRNTIGQIVISKQVNSTNKEVINFNGQKRGVYFLEIHSDSYSKTLRIVLQ